MKKRDARVQWGDWEKRPWGQQDEARAYLEWVNVGRRMLEEASTKIALSSCSGRRPPSRQVGAATFVACQQSKVNYRILGQKPNQFELLVVALEGEEVTADSVA